MTHDNVAHILGLHACAFQSGFDDQRAQIGGGHILQSTTERANGGTGSTHEDDFTRHGSILIDKREGCPDYFRL
jgi:hypothetical protein